jgi:phosphate-selective porin OprO/OprP
VAKGTATGKIEAIAFQGAAYLVVTGEDASFTGVRPARPFDPARGSGAFELAARFHQLTVKDAAFDGGFADPAKSARQATAFGGGVRWYLDRNVKLVADFEHTTFAGGAASGGDRPSENLVIGRVQTVL